MSLKTGPESPAQVHPPRPKVEEFDTVDLIRAKRDGNALSTEQIAWLIDAYTRGHVADEQMSAMVMAIFLRGMSRGEIHELTSAIIRSGRRMSFPGLGRPTVDKHSTGGVGDKITLPLVPLVASFGVAVPQLAGRGLGHTGGTLDKLESIPGWRAHLSPDEMLTQLREVGAVICAAGSGVAPADQRLYALRDVTGTVESIPLIASSIMSKKIAEGTDGLVLDVKFGSGAFLPEFEAATELATTMVQLAADAGLRTTALLTDMSAPLGYAIGNANEVRESVEILAGGGPADVVELTVALAQEMLALVGRPDEDVAAALTNGQAMDVWRRAIRAQGGDPEAALPTPRHSWTVKAELGGIVQQLEARPFGVAAWRLGAGRTRKEDAVSHAAGIDLHVKPGDRVQAGDPLFTLHTDDEDRFARAVTALAGAWSIAEAPVTVTPIVRSRISPQLG
jgi:thymidine phosphorylase